MYKWRLFIISFFLLPILIWANNPVVFRRVCKSNTINTLYFTPSADTCTIGFQYQIWARNGPFGSFELIDSIKTRSQDEYIHVNANPAGVPAQWSYFILTLDSCGAILGFGSDTVSVDQSPPTNTFIDSVSILTNTNQAIIGWQSNTSPDFSYFILYKDSLGNYIPLFRGRDTSYIDTRINSNPVNSPLKYDISPVDSCGNPMVFNIHPHSSIHLQSTIDTCSKRVRLFWTPYIGWQIIRKYYLFKQIGLSNIILVDSVFPTQLFITDTFSLGLNYRYFIRAIKDTIIPVSASSNSITFTTRKRIEPDSSVITLVSLVKPNDNQIEINIFNPGQEAYKYSIYSAENSTGAYSKIGELPVSSELTKTNIAYFPFNKNNKYYAAEVINRCGETFPVQNTSRYIENVAVSQNNQNNLSWDPYFTWNTGVSHYKIYRGTNDNSGALQYFFLDSVSGNESSYVDSLLPNVVGENGLCYFVKAIQNKAAISDSLNESFSTSFCVLGEFKVFIPTAFNPEGVNRTFRPEGSYIDYDNSQMEIYDRWGGLLININGIRSGWDGKDNRGNYCMPGVYFFKLFIKSTNGKEKLFNGFITLLN